MATKTRLTAVERARREKVRALIRDARESAIGCRSNLAQAHARLLDDLADVAQRYLEESK